MTLSKEDGHGLKESKDHHIQRTKESYCRGFKLTSPKKLISVFLAIKKITDACLIFFLFHKGNLIQRKILEDQEKAQLNRN